ncbi:MAG: thioesterase family protein [Rhodospirillales bacterium]|nr:thioesterase family protein [Rhodospirillales bacterium]
MAAATSQHHGSAAAPLPVAGRRVPQEWIDYNGHMNESRYLQAFSEAGDVFLAMIGADPCYVARGHSFFTAETHLRHLREMKPDADFSITLQILGADEKRVHIWQEMHRAADGAIAATCEQMLLHVGVAAGRACPVLPEVRARLDPIVAAHAGLPRPAAAGRSIGLGARP